MIYINVPIKLTLKELEMLSDTSDASLKVRRTYSKHLPCKYNDTILGVLDDIRDAVIDRYGNLEKLINSELDDTTIHN